MERRTIRLGFSSCPNDTFMFHGLVHDEADTPGLWFSVVMEDIEALNVRAMQGADALAVTKLSVSTLGHVLDRYAVLRVGAALGRGCGPLVVRRGDQPKLRSLAELRGCRVAIPGEGTTATLLLRLFAPPGLERVVLRFDQIMPAITRGEVDAGLIIHESRFTHAQHGLEQLADLGALWEAQTGLPLPLGVIVADRSLPQPVVRSIEAGLRRSLERAWADPGRSRAYVREHAQEISEAVCRQHIELYVNAYSADLGDVGLAALTRLLDESRRIGMLPGSSLPLLATS